MAHAQTGGLRQRFSICCCVEPGDLVVARGTLKQGSFEKEGEKVYTVDLNCDDFSILASAKSDKSENDEADAAPETQKKSAKRK